MGASAAVCSLDYTTPTVIAGSGARLTHMAARVYDRPHTVTAPTARITLTRQSPEDIGQREVFASLDGEEMAILRHGESTTREVQPGPHELRVHNTLFRKRMEMVLAPGEHAKYRVVNRPGWATYALMGVLGAGPLYLTLERVQQ